MNKYIFSDLVQELMKTPPAKKPEETAREHFFRAANTLWMDERTQKKMEDRAQEAFLFAFPALVHDYGKTSELTKATAHQLCDHYFQNSKLFEPIKSIAKAGIVQSLKAERIRGRDFVHIFSPEPEDRLKRQKYFQMVEADYDLLLSDIVCALSKQFPAAIQHSHRPVQWSWPKLFQKRNTRVFSQK